MVEEEVEVLETNVTRIDVVGWSDAVEVTNLRPHSFEDFSRSVEGDLRQVHFISAEIKNVEIVFKEFIVGSRWEKMTVRIFQRRNAVIEPVGNSVPMESFCTNSKKWNLCRRRGF